jgi:uncharacterized protein YoxC
MSIDDIVKLILVISIAFTLVGVSVQIIRLLGEFVFTIKEANSMLKSVASLVEKFTGDYDYIIEQVKMILDTVSGFINSVFKPLIKIFGFMGKFTDKTKGNKSKDSKNKSEESEDFEEDDEDLVD